MSASIHFDVPASFTPLDLEAAPIDGFEALVADLRAKNAAYAAVFADPPSRTGYFAITSVGATAADLERLAAEPAGDGEVRRIELACGEALTFTETTGSVVREHALVAHPDGTRVVAFTLATNDAQRRPEHAHLFAEVLATVAFDHPGP
jgi:hypothetical protein